MPAGAGLLELANAQTQTRKSILAWLWLDFPWPVRLEASGPHPRMMIPTRLRRGGWPRPALSRRGGDACASRTRALPQPRRSPTLPAGRRWSSMCRHRAARRVRSHSRHQHQSSLISRATNTRHRAAHRVRPHARPPQAWVRGSLPALASPFDPSLRFLAETLQVRRGRPAAARGLVAVTLESVAAGIVPRGCARGRLGRLLWGNRESRAIADSAIAGMPSLEGSSRAQPTRQTLYKSSPTWASLMRKGRL
jgi:hypothetical protein